MSKQRKPAIKPKEARRGFWDTPWGTLMVQGETQGPGGGPRFYFAQWHANAKPPQHLRDSKPEGWREADVIRKIDRWIKQAIADASPSRTSTPAKRGAKRS